MADPFATVVAEIQAEPELAAIPFDVGRLELETNNDWPRIVWIPTGSTIEATQHPGGRLVGVAPNQNRSRAIATEKLSVEVNIWGQDLTSAREMLHHVIALSWRILHGAVYFGSARYYNQEQGQAEYARRGQLIVLEMQWMVPVVESIAPLTVLKKEGFDGVYEGRAADETIVTHIS